MIFNNNTTSLVDKTPMAEGYDCSYGAALALVESARNDYAMFRAMLDVDARELQIQRESAGYVTEGEITALAESAASNIWKKIKDFFIRLAEKIKAIMHSFMAKINKLWMNDKLLISKYEKEVKNKNIDDLEVKWIEYKNGYLEALTMSNTYNKADGWVEEKEDRLNYFLSEKNANDFRKAANAEYGDKEDLKPENKKISAIEGGMDGIINFLKGYQTALRVIKNNTDEMIKNAENYAKDAKQDVFNKSYEKMHAKSEEKESMNADIESAKKAYDMAVAYQDATMIRVNWVLNVNKQQYKQAKAAFIKAVSYKKSANEAAYLEFMAEAAEEEVENVINDALSDEELSKICDAPLYVKDADVSDDPNKLTGGVPDYYSDNLSYVDVDGTVDTDINSKKNESAFFGALIY